MLTTTTLRPGLLISLKTSVRGNVSYVRQDIEAEYRTEAGAEKSRWETERTIIDPAEYEGALKVRSKARSIISGVCAHSAFGLLCPEAERENLARAVREARDLTERFNINALMTHVGVYVIAGRVASDDVEAAKAINSEVRDLLDSMAQGVKNVDVKVIRDAANKARQLGQMLVPQTQGQLQVAIDAARQAARAIVKAGEAAAIEVDQRAIRKITEQRGAFLDFEGAEVQAPVAGAGRAVDFELVDIETGKTEPAAYLQLDL